MACLTLGCSDCNPCSECQPVNPCYQDCGCLNPTTWACISQPGIHESIGVTNSMSGTQVLAAIATTIDALVVGEPAEGADKYAKVSASDTSSDYLNTKLLVASPITKTVINASADERIRFGLNFGALLSGDANNLVQLGTDGKLRVLAASDAPDIVVASGSGVTITGTGPASDPYIVSINPSISVVRPCFDSVWRNITLSATGNVNVVYVGGTPQYRYRYDGTVEFRGSATYTVAFGAYTTASRRFIVPMGSIPTTCLTAGEQTGISDLKAMTYIDASGTGDQIVQQYGYIIRKNAQNYSLEFQSAYISGATKTIVVNFDGAAFHPTI